MTMKDLSGESIVAARPALFRAAPFLRLTAFGLFAITLYAALVLRAVRPDAAWSHPNLSGLAELHPGFWVTSLTGLIGFVLGFWVWALRPRSLPATLFALSGLTTLMFTFGSMDNLFIYPTSGVVSLAFNSINLFGASAFGIVTCLLLIYYPARLPLASLLATAIIVIFSSWTLAIYFGLGWIGGAGQLVTLVEMICILILSGAQVWVSRGSAENRVIAIWLAACIIIGSGPFIFTVAAPVSFGYPPFLPFYYALGFFVLLYIGFAIGLMRLRLFDLGEWAFQLLFHTGLAITFVAIDLFLVSLITLQSRTAFILTALVMASAYLPLRGFLWAKLSGRKSIDETELFKAVIQTGLQPSGEARAKSWLALLSDVFNPLHMTQTDMKTPQVLLSRDGQHLFIPPIKDAPALDMQHKQNGRSLFTPRDQALAAQLVTLIQHVDDSRASYARGAFEERSRIARDIHDNIGAQLLQALHSKGPTRKDDMIRDTLSDLREVINNTDAQGLVLADMLADLRAETADRLAAQNITLSWTADSFDRVTLPQGKLYAMRSMLREAVSNALKHSGADKMSIHIIRNEEAIDIEVSDNGAGLKPASPKSGSGHGMKNMRSRVESFGGTFSAAGDEDGTRLTASFKLEDIHP